MAYEELQKWYSDYLSRIVGKIRGGQELDDREFQAALSHIQGWRLEELKKEIIEYVDKTKREILDYVGKVREELLANDERVKRELIEYVDKTKKDLIEYVDKTRNDIIGYVNKVREELLANDERIEKVVKDLGTRIDRLESRVSSLETKVSNLETRLSNIEAKVSNLETRVSNLEVRVDRLEQRIVELESKVDATRGDLGILAEDLYVREFVYHLERTGEKVVGFYRAYDTPLGEVDAVIETEKAVYVVEVKLKADTRDVDDLLAKTNEVAKEFRGKEVVPVLASSRAGKVVRGYAKGMNVRVW